MCVLTQWQDLFLCEKLISKKVEVITYFSLFLKRKIKFKKKKNLYNSLFGKKTSVQNKKIKNRFRYQFTYGKIW